MALNFQQLGMLAKLKSAFSTFQQEHPKFMPFIHAVKEMHAAKTASSKSPSNLRKDGIIPLISVLPKRIWNLSRC